MLAWRELTGGRERGRDGCRRTLVACSGGADSSGLVIALAAGLSAPEALIAVAHIVHDMRPEAEALADRDAAAALADRLELPFVETRISARRAGGNLEASSRRLRYRALARLAREEACPFIATAHHADDQLETILMGLVRGAGPAGLAGVSPRRRLNDRRTLIRPVLGLSRQELRDLCTLGGWHWREDRTNADPSRVRGALRQRVIPALKELRPGLEHRAAQSAEMFGEIRDLLVREAARLLAESTIHRAQDGLRLDRSKLRHHPRVVLGEVVRLGAEHARGEAGRDSLGHENITRAVGAITDESTDPRAFRWPGMELRVTAHAIEFRRDL